MLYRGEAVEKRNASGENYFELQGLPEGEFVGCVGEDFLKDAVSFSAKKLQPPDTRALTIIRHFSNAEDLPELLSGETLKVEIDVELMNQMYATVSGPLQYTNGHQLSRFPLFELAEVFVHMSWPTLLWRFLDHRMA